MTPILAQGHLKRFHVIMNNYKPAYVCASFPGECVVPQHKLVVADFRFRVRVHRDKRAKIARTKWWKLRGEAAQRFKKRMLGEGP